MLDEILRIRPNCSVMVIGNDVVHLQNRVRSAAAGVLGDKRPLRNCHPDYIELDNSLGEAKTEVVREWLQRADSTPFEGKRIVMTLLSVEDIDVAASNAILKTVEEPPAHVTVVLSTRNPSKVLPTIVSRVFRVLDTAGVGDLPAEVLLLGHTLLQKIKGSVDKGPPDLSSIEDLPLAIEAAMALSQDARTLSYLLYHLRLLRANNGRDQVSISLARKLRA